MQYRELTEEEYYDRLRVVVAGAEGISPRAENIGDGMATIGYGYTFNRNNNVQLWRNAGIQLTAVEQRTLAAIDAADAADRTRLGLTFTRTLDEAEANRLLRASMRDYEGPADALTMPLSEERVAMVSLTYNRGPDNILGNARKNIPEHPIMDAIRNDDRAEAWFQMRYNCWGSADEAFEGGLRKRRFAEAHVFGLYDDPQNVPLEEAISVLKMYELHREEIDRVEDRYGVSADGTQARRNRIADANRDYPLLVREYGRVQTITEATAAARTALMADAATQHSDLAQRFENDFRNGSQIFIDAGRALQDADQVNRDYPIDTSDPRTNVRNAASRREQVNASIDAIDPNHAATIDSRRMQRGTEVVSNDLLIGEGGDDTLRAHRGDDILIGGQGRDRMEGGEGRDTYVIGAGDTVLDSDGLGEVRRDGQVLTGGARIDSDPPDTWRSADGRYSYSMAGPHLHIVDAQAADAAQREPVVIENFRNGQLGITLSGPDGPARIGEVPQPITAPQPDAAAAPALAQPQSDTRSFSTGDPDLDRLAAALYANDDAAISQAATRIAQSDSMQAFERWGHDLLAWQEQQERQQALDRQAQERQQQDGFSR